MKPGGDSVETTQAEERALFREGDLALMVDSRGRRYLVKLEASRTFHTHLGAIPHTDIIGLPSGSRVRTATGQPFLALKPTLAEYIQEIPRATQIIYPKDIALILVLGDVFPGARVLEAGMGSGALTLALLRAVGPQGQVISYEAREEYIPRALRNIREVFPDPANHTVKVGDVYQGFPERGLDRVFLDLPEPWRVVPCAAEALVPGGILLCYLPTVLQVHRLVMSLHEHPAFDLVETVECLLRPWHITRNSARPVHRMVAHTGFIVTARRCQPGKEPPPEEPPEEEQEEGNGPGQRNEDS